MTRTAAEEELNLFITNGKRTYKFIQEFIPNHYVTVQKILVDFPDGTTKDEFIVLEDQSTTSIANFNKDLFLKLLIKEELVVTEQKWMMSTTDMRTDGCCCGAWATSNPNNHVDWCLKNKYWRNSNYD